MRTYVALIRAIGPLTHPKMPMAGLREACTDAGFTDVATVLATGNVLFRVGGSRKAVLARLRAVIDGFGLDNAVVLRTPAELEQIVSANPFPDAVSRGSEFAVFFLAEPAKDTGWMAGLSGPERLELKGLDLYVDYSGGVSASPLTPAKIEKRLGVVTTFRNWNTVMKLLAAAEKLGGKP
ncbi:hypothetical protein VE25_16155 [Devosia geojensis]|uniref:DUF1697 domain-containing protein n=1 Tax=Devosia geojensis TaxID=443610 RepID=A0A0F5FRK2_9HYPH|nr:DUF1697 domain-containing protein [Devosia geojensis]KKB10797.1 hypothetical protein VE25_16155 [Devosia geojensis]